MFWAFAKSIFPNYLNLFEDPVKANLKVEAIIGYVFGHLQSKIVRIICRWGSFQTWSQTLFLEQVFWAYVACCACVVHVVYVPHVVCLAHAAMACVAYVACGAYVAHVPYVAVICAIRGMCETCQKFSVSESTQPEGAKNRLAMPKHVGIQRLSSFCWNYMKTVKNNPGWSDLRKNS